jgi:D-3-phosphoglycerate dehydrogenase
LEFPSSISIPFAWFIYTAALGDGWIGIYYAREKKEISMAEAVVDNLILDLLEWIAIRDRSYEEVLDAWRTSCPRLPVWEEANDRGLIKMEELNGRCVVKISCSGRALLEGRKSSR